MKRVHTTGCSRPTCMRRATWREDCFVTIKGETGGLHDHGSVDRVRQTVSCPAHRARRPGDVAGALGGRTCTCTLENACGLKIESARAKGMRANSCRLYWVVTSFVDGSFVDGRRARKCQRVSTAVRVESDPEPLIYSNIPSTTPPIGPCGMNDGMPSGGTLSHTPDGLEVSQPSPAASVPLLI